MTSSCFEHKVCIDRCAPRREKSQTILRKAEAASAASLITQIYLIDLMNQLAELLNPISLGKPQFPLNLMVQEHSD